MTIIDLTREPDAVFAETDAGWEKLARTGEYRWGGNGVAVRLEPGSPRAENENVEPSSQRMRLEPAGAQKRQEPSRPERKAAVRLKLLVLSPGAPLRTIKLRWSASLPERLAVLGDHWERAYGDLEWRGIAPERVMPWYFLTYDGNATNGYGVETGAKSLCFWQLDAEGVTLTGDVRSGPTGVRLGERELEAAVIVAMAGQPSERLFAAVRRFCGLLCAKPALLTHPVYGGNNWYYAYGNSSDEQMMADARFMSELAGGHPNRPYMIIDDGWQLSSGGGACNGGPWEGNARFPDMPGLAARMKAAGVRPGIWFRPLLISHGVPKEWIRFVNEQGHIVLDPTVPEALDCVAESMSRLVGWGYELVKHDFTTFDLLGRWGFEMKASPNGLASPFRDSSRTTAEIILDLYKRLAAAAGEAVVIGCNTVGHLAAGLFELQRTGDDTSGRSWERTRYMGVNTLAFRMPQHGTFYAHDADCVGIGENVPWELNRQWLELVAASGTPLFVSADPAAVTAEQKAALRQAFRLAAEPQPPGEPLDWLSNRCPARWRLRGEERSFRWNELSVPTLAHADNHWWG